MPLNAKQFLKSKIHKKILLFFVENEGSIDTARGLSVWTNQNIVIVTKALEELAAAGFLKAHRTSSTVGYSCVLNGKKLQNLISRADA